jgi:hypothetical protein
MYDTWQNDDLKYYWKGYSLDTVPFDWRFVEERDRIALTWAAAGDRRAIAALERIAQSGRTDLARQRASDLLKSLNT